MDGLTAVNLMGDVGGHIRCTDCRRHLAEAEACWRKVLPFCRACLEERGRQEGTQTVMLEEPAKP